MPLELLLFALAVLMRRLAHRPDIRAKLRGRSGSIQIRTKDGLVGRHFVFCEGELFSRRGVLTAPDVALVWRDAATASRVLRSPDSLDAALAQDWLTIEGNAELAAWFGDLVRTMRARESRASGPLPMVAVVGLGRMGSAIAGRIAAAGFPLTVYNRSGAKAQPLLALGAAVAPTPAEAARKAGIVVTSLMDDASVISLVEGPTGVLAGLAPGGIHIGTSTVSPQASTVLAQAHRAHGSSYLAAPIVGRPEAARAGELMVLASGERGAFEAVGAVLRAFARRVEYLGENPAAANLAKLAVNYSAASLIELMGEVYAFGEKVGLPGAALHQVFRALWAQPALQGYATRMWQRDFDDVGFDLRSGLKDLTLMRDAAQAAGVSWALVDPICRKMAKGIELGFAEQDWSTTYEVTRAESGLEATGAPDRP